MEDAVGRSRNAVGTVNGGEHYGVLANVVRVMLERITLELE